MAKEKKVNEKFYEGEVEVHSSEDPRDWSTYAVEAMIEDGTFAEAFPNFIFRSKKTLTYQRKQNSRKDVTERIASGRCPMASCETTLTEMGWKLEMGDGGVAYLSGDCPKHGWVVVYLDRLSVAYGYCTEGGFDNYEEEFDITY